MRGKLHEAVWSQYQQEPQPGAPDYLILPTRPRLDMLGLIPCFWLEAMKLPHLLRPFCCQHLPLVFCSSGSSDFLVPRYCLEPLMALSSCYLFSPGLWSSKPNFRQHWDWPVFPRLWNQGSRKTLEPESSSQGPSSMRKEEIVRDTRWEVVDTRQEEHSVQKTQIEGSSVYLAYRDKEQRLTSLKRY